MSDNVTPGSDRMIRVQLHTRQALRLAASEMGVVSGVPVASINDAILRLIDHWNRTKPKELTRLAGNGHSQS